MTALVLFLLFTLGPILETWGIIEVGKVLGSWQTALYLVAVGAIGAWLGRRAGVGVLREVGETLRRGESPADKLLEGVLILMGATLLITPGFLSDLAGILTFIGPVRRWAAPRLRAFGLEWLRRRGWKLGPAGPGPRAQEQARAQARFEHPIPKE